jgi:aarF domain-containing kinase
MVAQLTDEESANFIGVLCSLGEGDGKLAAECALRFSKENSKLTEEERQAFIDDIILVFEERCRGYHTNVDVGHVLRGILSMIRKHHVRIDANYATLVVNALCVESLARRVCPSYNVLDASKPMLQTYRKIAYTKDGVPIKVSHHAVKRAMPLMNFRKDRQDNAFFKQRLRTLKQNRKK